MTPHLPFRRRAGSYDRYNLIQSRVAAALATRIGRPYGRIVDLGCGSGGFFRAWPHPFERYLAVDISPEMLALHPDDERVEKRVGDFNDPAFFEELEREEFDLLVSSSALQWAEDLDATLFRIARLKRPTALAIFTAETFRTLHAVAGVVSPIRKTSRTVALLQKHFPRAAIETLSYRLFFRDTLSMLRYIRHSGVSGGGRDLGYREVCRLLREYPLDHLEFEVVCAVNAGERSGS